MSAKGRTDSEGAKDSKGSTGSKSPRRKNGGRGAGGGRGDIGRALRTIYDDTLREPVPDDFLSLIGKLD